MANTPNHIQRLHEAGVLNQEHFTGDDRKVLEGLSSEEVDTLIRIRARVGDAPAGKEHMRPNFIV